MRKLSRSGSSERFGSGQCFTETASLDPPVEDAHLRRWSTFTSVCMEDHERCVWYKKTEILHRWG